MDLQSFLEATGAAKKGWEAGDLGDTVICPDGHEIEFDGTCPDGHRSPVL